MSRSKAVIKTLNPDGETGTIEMLKGPNKGEVLPFQQPLASADGLRVDDEVRASIIDNQGTAVAVSLVRPQKGVIKTINPDGQTGTLESVFGESYNYNQPFVNQLGITVDAEVRFRIVTSQGVTSAVSLSVVSED